ncbi:hypothetical protein LGR64_10480 [Delftia sp. Lp-1]|uniref:HNH endonuclease n=1 Tax=Delftia sp. Lp-1 TaxID=682863 RepID=UPI001E43144A|nr:hypothetical protein [Delftia sp. Lp-1]MCB4786698.1 hypothetical protein [Delftia sp. Lp-1]
MKPLFFTEVNDADLLEEIPEIGHHNIEIRNSRSEIIKQYAHYRSALRRPVPGTPPISNALKQALLSKYSEGRAGSGIFSFIQDRANQARTRSCPYCGRGGLGTIDHYLPKEYFSWFSVYSWNLVPSCQECQNIKGTKIGTTWGPRPIHPLLDRIGLSQSLVVRPIFHAPDVMLTTFKMSVISDRSFKRNVRKREKHLFQRHWRFFGADRQDVLSACRTSLADIKIALQTNVNSALPDVSTKSVHWIKSKLNRALNFEEVSSDHLLYIGLLRALCTDRYSLEQLVAAQLPTKALTRRSQQALLRAR